VDAFGFELLQVSQLVGTGHGDCNDND
jgi:hypothetical protein